jgi:hypothetical protein
VLQLRLIDDSSLGHLLQALLLHRPFQTQLFCVSLHVLQSINNFGAHIHLGTSRCFDWRLSMMNASYRFLGPVTVIKVNHNCGFSVYLRAHLLSCQLNHIIH